MYKVYHGIISNLCDIVVKTDFVDTFVKNITQI